MLILMHIHIQLLAYQKRKKKAKHKKKPVEGGADANLSNLNTSSMSEPASLNASLGVVDLRDDGSKDISATQYDDRIGSGESGSQIATSLPPVRVVTPSVLTLCKPSLFPRPSLSFSRLHVKKKRLGSLRMRLVQALIGV